MAQKVRVIPPTINRTTAVPVGKVAKRKVAAYARVSTDQEEQLTSYEAQVSYYTDFIQANDDWKFVKVYTDEGVTGTSTKHREGFQEMIEDALAGKIDLIVTKSVSRFARNTVDSLTNIRLLKEHGTEVYFEKESIWSFDSKGELLLTIMSSLAQEESRSISENVRWGQRKKFSDGRYSLNYRHFLGYDKGEDGKLVINPEQAEIVRQIFGMYLEGASPYQIAKRLTEKGIPSPAGKPQWNDLTIRRVLSNETYMGDKLLQKTYSLDFLHKDRLKNNGEVQQYYVEGDHEAIIPPRTFKRVQHEIERRKSCHATGGTIFSGKIVCGQCGQIYGPKVWHPKDKYRRVIWQCNDKYRKNGTPRCKTPHLTEEQVKETFLKVCARIYSEKDEIIDNLRMLLSAVEDTAAMQAEADRLSGELDVISEMLQREIDQNARVAQDQDAYTQRFTELSARFAEVQAAKDKTDAAIAEKESKGLQIRTFIEAIEELPADLTEFRSDLWADLVETATVQQDNTIRYRLYSGQEITVRIG